jgi:hypothetical protein
MERVFSAVFTTPSQREHLKLKHIKYKEKLAKELIKKQSIFRELREKEAIGNHVSSLRLFSKFCLSGFAKGYMFKMIFSLVFRVVKRPGQKIPISYFISEELFRFGGSVGLVVGLYRGILSFLRQRRYQTKKLISNYVSEEEEEEEEELSDRYDRAIAGFVGGLGLLINDAEYRQFASKYAFVRALDLLRNRGERLLWFPKIEKLSYYLFGLINGPIMYSLLVDPTLLSAWYYDWILWMGDLTKENLHSTIHQYIQSGAKQPSNPCEGLLYKTGGSRWYIVLDWFYGLYRAATMYGPVHLVPMLLFRTREMMSNPTEMLAYLVKNVWLSSCFLSSYQFIVKISAMPLMEIFQAFGSNGVLWPSKFALCGILTAFSCEFERPSRVNELMLYCATHTMDVIWNWLCKNGFARSFAYGEVLFFCTACSITFSTELQDFKPAYRSMLQYLLQESDGSEITKTGDNDQEKEELPTIITGDSITTV